MKHAFLIATLLFALLPGQPAFADITPDREIVPVDSPKTPLWKSYWDTGRDLARQGKYVIAAEYYKELVLRKPQIEEAKWEYCKILHHLEEYDVAAPLLESLIENNPNQQDYLHMAGQVALQRGEYRKAVDYLGQIYARNPEGQTGTEILASMVEALEKLGKKRHAFALGEQLYLRDSNNKELLLSLARNAKKFGYTGKANRYYHSAVTSSSADSAILKEAAEHFSATGSRNKAAELWQQLSQREPDNVIYRQRLKEYHLDSGDKRVALKHIAAILEHDGFFDPALLLQAARIYNKDLKRPDKSLRYYERYIQLMPNDKKVRVELARARESVAVSLLPIVENDGAEMLWMDLKTVTLNRLIIFQLIAEKLKNTGKTKTQIKLLEVIHAHSSNKADTANMLAELYYGIGEFEKAYVYLTNLGDKEKPTREMLLNKARVEEKLGKDLQAFHSYRQAWAVRPEDHVLADILLRNAGLMGLVDELIEVGDSYLAKGLVERNLHLYFNYIEGLSRNGQYDKAGLLYGRLLNADWAIADTRVEILLHRASSLHRSGDQFGAERILRSLLASDKGGSRTVKQLIDLAIDRQLPEEGWALFKYYSAATGKPNWQEEAGEYSLAMFDAYTSLLGAQGDYDTATDELEWFLDQHGQKGQANEERVVERFARKLGYYYIFGDKYDKFPGYFERYGRYQSLHPFLKLTTFLMENRGSVDAKQVVAKLSANSDGNTLIDLFRIADEARALNQSELSGALLTYLGQRLPQSLSTKIYLVELAAEADDISQAAIVFQSLHNQYPEEKYFLRRYLELEFKKANYGRIIGELDSERVHFLPMHFKLLRTRALWAMEQQKEALKGYQELLKPPVISLFKQRLAEKNFNFDWQENERQTFWNLYTFEQSDQLERLNSLTDEEGFLTFIGTPIAEITADLYEKFRWEKLIRNEYLERKALADN